jgi:DNA-binding FadR family transcriptional regulator
MVNKAEASGKDGCLLRDYSKKSVVALQYLLNVLRSAKAGDKLPSEREIGSILKMTRSPVREALIALQIAGRLRIEPGVGAFVIESARPAQESLELTLLSENESPDEVRALRQAIESAMVVLAISELTKDSLTRIEQAYEDMETAARENNGSDFLEAHRRFHLAIAAASGNTLFLRMEEWVFYDIMKQPMWKGVMEVSLKESQVRIKQSLHEHSLLLEAIRRKRPERASRLLGGHFKNVLALEYAQPARR